MRKIGLVIMLLILAVPSWLLAQRISSQMNHIVPSGSLSGTVTVSRDHGDQASHDSPAPIEDATVTEYAPGTTNQIAQVRTNKDGYFEFPKPESPGMPRLKIEAEGMQSVYLQVNIIPAAKKLHIQMYRKALPNQQ